MKIFSLLVCLGVLLSGCAHTSEMKSTDSIEGAKLNAIVTKYSEAVKHLDAYGAPYFNVEEDLGKFGDYASPAFFAREKALIRSTSAEVATIDSSKLIGDELKTYRLFSEDIRLAVRGLDFPDELLQFNQMGNRFHGYMDDSSPALTSFPFNSVKHYDDFVHRSEGFPAFVDNQIELMRRGIREKITLSCVAAKVAPHSYKDALEMDVEKNPFFRPIGAMPKTFPEADRTRLANDFRMMIKDRIIPGYHKFDNFFREEYSPHCRKGFGIGALPNGKEWYALAIESTTNLKLDPSVIHQTGLNEIARISREMEKIKKELGFKGTLKEFQNSMLKNPKNFFGSAKEMFAEFEKVKAEVAAKVPNFFSLVPKSDYKIVESSNPEDAGASYNGPTENLPFGRFVVNTKNLHIVPKYEVTTLSLHESEPGHHFQVALQFEMKDRLSEYRRKMYFSGSFVEGWALYAEYLGNEMGMYKDPMQRYGHLNDEMLRAVRLVVDTGIHAMNWSREKAVAFMVAHLATSERDIGIEVNRYSVWPGQALGYKLGQLKILELRHLAEKELGSKFDIKGFHAAVIGSGTVSLGVLETQVHEWIDAVKAAKVLGSR
jgi:uncharacterized protein (DUF885 family)